MKREGGVSVKIEGLTVGYGRNRILEKVSMMIEPGELLTLLGPSGCGKSTLLRAIAGLHPPWSGELFFAGRSVARVPPEKRQAAMVFQRPLLFPWLSVAGNVGFGLRMRQIPEQVAHRRVEEALSLVRLEGFADRSPSELSGGQEQRVALARALVTEPDLLLLDEPFTALDETLRREMRRLVRELQQRLGVTTIFVTHDQNEAAAMADRIALILDGRLAQIDPPHRFYSAPANPEVARFFGWQLFEREGRLLALRPELVRLRRVAEGLATPIGAPILARVHSVRDLGLRMGFGLELEDGSYIETTIEQFRELTDSTAAERWPQPGERVSLDFPAAAAVYFPL